MRHRSSAAPSVLQLLRDTALVRRNTRRARVCVSVVAAVAVLTLVTGMAPAYAEEAPPPDPAAAKTADTTEPAA